MKRAKIETKKYGITKDMSIAEDLGLAESDLDSIRSNLLGIEDEKKIDTIYIDKCTPYNIVLSERTEYMHPIATVLFLCTDNNDNMFTLFHNYIVMNDDDITTLQENPLFVDNQFMSVSLMSMMLNTLDSYNLNISFSLVDDEDIPNQYPFSTIGYIKDKENPFVKFYVTSQVMNIISFTDTFTVDPDQYRINSDSLMRLMLFTDGYLNKESYKRIFLDQIHEITYLSTIDKKNGIYHIGFKIDNPDSKSETDKYLLLSYTVTLEGRFRPNINEKDFSELSMEADRYSYLYHYDGIINDKTYTIINMADTDKNSQIQGLLMLFLDIDVYNSLIDMTVEKFGR